MSDSHRDIRKFSSNSHRHSNGTKFSSDISTQENNVKKFRQGIQNQSKWITTSLIENSNTPIYLPDLVCFGPPNPNENILYESIIQSSPTENEQRIRDREIQLQSIECDIPEYCCLSAALTIQRFYRKHKSNQSKFNIHHNNNKNNPTLSEQIQAKNHYSYIESYATATKELYPSCEAVASIVCVQKYIRSALQQKAFHQMRSLIIKLQTHIRRFLAKKKLFTILKEEKNRWDDIEQKIFGPWSPSQIEEMTFSQETNTVGCCDQQLHSLLQRFHEHNQRWERWAELDTLQTAHIATLKVSHLLSI
jgi:hypothetical protein